MLSTETIFYHREKDEYGMRKRTLCSSGCLVTKIGFYPMAINYSKVVQVNAERRQKGYKAAGKAFFKEIYGDPRTIVYNS